MNRFFNMFKNEGKVVYKQCILFTLITSLLFTLSVSVCSFALDIIGNAERYVDEEYPDGISLYVDSNSIQDFLSYKDDRYFLKIDSGDILSNSGMKASNLKYSPLYGSSLFFDNSFISYDSGIKLVSGRLWTVMDNDKQNGMYNIFISTSIATVLQVKAGDTVSLEDKNGRKYHEADFRVAGVYKEGDLPLSDFILPMSYICDIFDIEFISPQYEMFIYKASDVIDVMPKLNKNGLNPTCGFASFVTLDFVQLIYSSKSILIACSALVFILTVFILNNVVSITINSRKEFIAKMRLLGGGVSFISLLYTSFMSVCFLVSFSLGYVMSALFKNYYENLATIVFDFPISMQLRGEVFLILFIVGVALLFLRFFLLMRKISKISPLEYMRCEL